MRRLALRQRRHCWHVPVVRWLLLAILVLLWWNTVEPHLIFLLPHRQHQHQHRHQHQHCRAVRRRRNLPWSYPATHTKN